MRHLKFEWVKIKVRLVKSGAFDKFRLQKVYQFLGIFKEQLVDNVWQPPIALNRALKPLFNAIGCCSMLEVAAIQCK